MIPFPSITDNLALDFINTRFLKNNKIVNLLNNHNELSDWLKIHSEKYKLYSIQFEALLAFYRTEEDVRKLIEFRDQLYHFLIAYIQSELLLPELIAWIEEKSSQQPLALQHQCGQLICVPKPIGNLSLQTIVLLELSALINHQEIEDLSKCYNEACVLLFINKTHKRKWCSMDICGNRQKVARFIKK